MIRAVVFAYSSVGVKCIEVLMKHGIKIELIYTHKDDPNEEKWFDSVYDLAVKNNLQVLTPDNLDNEYERVKKINPDVIFSFYYRALIPMKILDIAKLGAFNMHGSLLPKYRGRACVNWAVLNGETQTGVTLHHMTARADRGNIVGQKSVMIGPDETSHEVFLKIIPAAGELLDDCIDAIISGNAEGIPQDESKATLFGRRTPKDGIIDWSWPSKRIHDLVRAVAFPFPGAFTFINNEKFMVWKTKLIDAKFSDDIKSGTILSINPLIVRTGDGAIEILKYDGNIIESGMRFDSGVKE